MAKRAHAAMARLPTPLLACVLGWLTADELRSAKCVCAHWARTRAVRGCLREPSETLHLFEPGAAHSLVLQPTFGACDCLDLSAFHALRELRLWCRRALLLPPHGVSVTLAAHAWRPTDMLALAASLTCVRGYVFTSREDLEAVLRLPRLRELQLLAAHDVPSVSGVSGVLAPLARLDLEDCSRIGFLDELARLEDLRLSGFGVRPADLPSTTRRRLRSLHVRASNAWVALPDLERVERLVVRSSTGGDPDQLAEQVKRMPRLRHLALGGVGGVDVAAPVLEALTFGHAAAPRLSADCRALRKLTLYDVGEFGPPVFGHPDGGRDIGEAVKHCRGLRELLLVDSRRRGRVVEAELPPALLRLGLCGVALRWSGAAPACADVDRATFGALPAACQAALRAVPRLHLHGAEWWGAIWFSGYE